MFVLVLFSPLLSARAQKITQYDVKVKINQDASVEVEERIEYDFEGESRHGIFRTIPVKYKTKKGNNRKIKIKDIDVFDENGNNRKFKISSEGGNKKIKIGDPKKKVDGKQVYLIKYTVKRAINYFNTHDELYWNVVGDQWDIPIEKASAKIESLQIERIECFQGVFVSSESCSKKEQLNQKEALFEANNIGQGKFFTIVVGVEKGLLYQPSSWLNIRIFFWDNLIWLSIPIVFLVMMVIWYREGRDPEGRGVVVAQYEPPQNLSLLEMDLMLNEGISNRAISAEIIQMAINGYLKIKKVKKGSFLEKEDYLFIKKKRAGNDLDKSQRQIINKIFSGSKSQRKMSDLANKFYKINDDLIERAGKALIKRGYYRESPEKVRENYLAAALLVFLGGVAIVYFTEAVFYGFAIFISAIIIYGFGHFMPRATRKGARLREEILGLKLYLEVAEKDRIKFHNAPAKTPEHFEKLLPYAMLLGVEEEWAEQFKDIYQQNSDWYSDGSGNLSSLALASGLSNFQSKSSSGMLSAPSSASSGGSGFSGGGSGGGFGGGGGGSW